MFALCIEASHRRGMGHLFRAVNFFNYLASRGEPAIVLLNDDRRAIQLLRDRGIPFQVVDLLDTASDWEGALIRRLGVTVWFNDRLDTDIRHARHVTAAGVLLATMDDRGGGAALSELHFAPLVFEEVQKLEGKKVLAGPEYLILDPGIGQYRRLRQSAGQVIVSLGGSDTYGVTLKVLAILRRLGKPATIHVGPAFGHRGELEKLLTPDYPLLEMVPSLAEAFSRFDLAITGGGVTPFEANAAGLPCLIIANEDFEIPVGRFLGQLGSSLFAGHHEAIESLSFDAMPDVATMSRIGMERLSLEGAANIHREIQAR